MAVLRLKLCAMPGVAPTSFGTSSWHKKATSFFRWTIAVRRGGAMPLKRRCTFAWAHRSFPTSGTASNISSRFPMLMPIASAWGWSYGGHMTLHAMFEAGDDFKVGFAGGPVTDWRSYDSIYTERYLGLPQKNGKGYQDSSPVKYAR